MTTINCTTVEYRKAASLLLIELPELSCLESENELKCLGLMYLGISDDLEDKRLLDSNALVYEIVCKKVLDHWMPQDTGRLP